MATPPICARWDSESAFTVSVVFTPDPVPTGGTGCCELSDPGGADDLFATDITTATGTGLDSDCIVVWGAGGFAEFSGTGSAQVAFTSNPQVFPTTNREIHGRYTLIPKPSGLALVLAAAVAAGAAGRRLSARAPAPGRPARPAR